MNKVLVVSPHFDDAVLSAGQFMAERPDTVLVTVLGGFPDNPMDVSTDYDRKCGFKHAYDAVSVRRRENDAASALLNATKVDLDFPDGQYGIHVSEEQITEVLQRMVDSGNYEAIYAPIGIGHPDHVKVSNAVIALQTDLPIELWEDIPTRVAYPQEVPPRLAELGLEYEPTRVVFNKVFMTDKIRAMSCYGSQVGTGILDPYLMYVPERFYKYEK
jgi:LmbE family N-acetylglucosaminyl deacetylase